MGEEYGPLTSLTVPGQRFLIVNSMEAAKELLEKRGSTYVDRPKFVFLRKLLGGSAPMPSCIIFTTVLEGRRRLLHNDTPIQPQVAKASFTIKARPFFASRQARLLASAHEER